MLEISGFEIKKSIYSGNKTVIYRAVDKTNNNPVIIKLLKEEYPTPEEIKSFQYEFNILKSFKHKGIITVYRMIDFRNTKAIIMEDFNADSLNIILKKGKLSLKQFLEIAINVVDILSVIHNNKIIYKDMKPHNILFNSENKEVKLIDFGISTELTKDSQAVVNPAGLEGTLAYISPEQTGRMNRVIDYRSDYYSLGITFYEMLTGTLPFRSTDIMEMVHSHIAKKPTPPIEVDSSIPESLSDIVMKLLEKTAENRYQSIYGLQSDLKECYKQLSEKGRIDNFRIGSFDLSDHFQIPEKLYGRENELKKLLNTFDKVSEGSKQLLFFSGISGIGKSVLINEIHKPITKRKGYFISGKYDQLARRIPYTAIIQAFQALIKELFTESKEELEKWKERILKAVGNNGQVIIDFIPEVEQLIGKQPEVESLQPVETQNRFNLVFLNFIKTFAQKKHPLVLFLDDLQWVDSASLQLIQTVLLDDELKHFLFIGSFRDNEVEKGHPLSLMLDKISETINNWENIKLPPLTREHISQMLSDTLSYDFAKLEKLAELVNNKTAGNPFFVKEFLINLYETGLITFKNGWKWDIDRINSTQLTDNVIELMAGKLKQLPEKTLEVLKVACCIGINFDLTTLAIVTGQSEDELFNALIMAINEGMIIRSDRENRFVHDKVREAAYTLLSNEKQKELHYKIGRTILEQSNEKELEENEFTIANQLNLAKDLLTDEEREKLISININSGKKAKLSAAYEASAVFLKEGAELLEKNSWDNNYETTLELYTELGESLFLSAKAEEAEEIFNRVLDKSKKLMDKIKIYSLKIDQYSNQAQYTEALEVGLEALKQLGVELPHNPDQSDIGKAMEEAAAGIGDREIKTLIDLPEMNDPDKLAIMNLLMSCFAPAIISNPGLMVIIISKIVSLSLKYGNTLTTAYGFVIYGIICSNFDMNLGYKLAKHGMDLADKYGLKSIQGKTRFSFGASCVKYKDPLSNAVPLLLQGSEYCREAGDLQYSGYCYYNMILNSYFEGKNLSLIIEQIVERHASTLYKLNQPQNSLYFNIWRQAILTLQAPVTKDYSLSGEYFNENTTVQTLIETSDMMGLGYYYFIKATILFLYNNYSDTIKFLEKVESHIPAIAATSVVMNNYNFMLAITLCALYPNSSEEQKKEYLEKLNAIQGMFESWAEINPNIFLHEYKLISAEINRITGKPMEETIMLYNKAIDVAKEKGFTHEEALANELAAKYYLVKGLDKIAASYMQEAHFCYIKWGCNPKAEQLEATYPALFASLEMSAQRKTQELNHYKTTITRRSSSGATTTIQLDMDTIMKASYTITSEIEMSNLLKSMMKIMIENAGAQKGFIILKNDDESLVIEAEGEVDKEALVLQSIPLSESTNLSTAIVRYCAKTRETLVLGNASETGIFTKDEYVINNKPLSVLAVPIVYQKKTVGILYLENNLSPDVFTPARVETLRVLSSQAAISIENARMVEQMREKERLKREMELAERLQTSLVPPAPDHDELDIAVCMKPAAEVGGDYYDTIFDMDKKLWLAIGDVSGHGMTPGLVMMMAETAFHTHIIDSKGKTPRDAVIAVNKVLTENIRTRLKEKHFMTMSFVKYEGDGNFSHSGAHLDIMVYRKATGKVELFKTEGLYLGIMPDLSKIAQDKSFKLETGDVMLLYTDGIIEAPKEDDNEKQFGKDTLIKLLEEKGAASANEIMEAVKGATLEWCGVNQDDDITMVVAKRKL